MTPDERILDSRGKVSFTVATPEVTNVYEVSSACTFCGAYVGPMVVDKHQITSVDILHLNGCYYIEAAMLNRAAWAGRHDH